MTTRQGREGVRLSAAGCECRSCMTPHERRSAETRRLAERMKAATLQRSVG